MQVYFVLNNLEAEGEGTLSQSAGEVGWAYQPLPVYHVAFGNVQFNSFLRSPGVNADYLNQQSYRGPWEVFQILDNGDGTYAIVDNFGGYLSFRGSGEFAEVKTMPALGPWEKVIFEPNPDAQDNSYCIKSAQWGNYLRASGNLENVNTQTYCGPWEKWTIELVL